MKGPKVWAMKEREKMNAAVKKLLNLMPTMAVVNTKIHSFKQYYFLPCNSQLLQGLL
jgi:hypothetical protein